MPTSEPNSTRATMDLEDGFAHAITAGRLRTLLAEFPDDMPVILASDAEGNSHSPLSQIASAMYLPTSTWSGELYLTPEDLATKRAARYGHETWGAEDIAPAGAVRVIELSPVN